MTVPLKIRKGKRRLWIASPDEPLDGPIKVEVISGNSTASVNTEDVPGNPDAKAGLSGYFNGDGDIGSDKQIDLVADGHIGEGEVVVRLSIALEVTHPDATTLGLTFGDEEDIPAPAAPQP